MKNKEKYMHIPFCTFKLLRNVQSSLPATASQNSFVQPPPSHSYCYHHVMRYSCPSFLLHPFSLIPLSSYIHIFLSVVTTSPPLAWPRLFSLVVLSSLYWLLPCHTLLHPSSFSSLLSSFLLHLPSFIHFTNHGEMLE